MFIYVNIQQIGRRRPSVQAVPMGISGVPDTLSELIALCVETCVKRQHLRATGSGEIVLSKEQIEDLATVGRIAFGLDANGALADEKDAIANALQGYRDGLFRVFLNGQELRSLDAPVRLGENDALTFVRLTMLSGISWHF